MIYFQKTKIILTFLFLLVNFIVFGQKPVEDSIELWMAEAKIPGVQHQHTGNGESLPYTVGEMEKGSGRMVEASTIFQAASLSKVVFSYAVLRLWDKGLIDLDTPLLSYYDYERLSDEPDGDRITARMVLAHTTGFPNWQVKTGNPEWKQSKLKTAFEPGTAFRYSGEGFYFLQKVLEHLTGKSLEEIMEEEVFQKFGMENSSFLYINALHKDRYANGHDGERPMALRKYKKSNSAFSLLTNAKDYTLFIEKAFLEKQGLSEKAHNEWLEQQSSAQPENKKNKAYDYLNYGLGVLLQENENGKALIHTGSNPGFRCFFITYPQKNESLVYFSNSTNGKKIMDKVATTF